MHIIRNFNGYDLVDVNTNNHLNFLQYAVVDRTLGEHSADLIAYIYYSKTNKEFSVLEIKSNIRLQSGFNNLNLLDFSHILNNVFEHFVLRQTYFYWTDITV